MRETKSLIAVILIVLVAASGTAAAFTMSTASEQNGAVAQEQTTQQTTQQPTDANVTFANQTSNGSTVTVESATLPNGGFVAIYNGSYVSGNLLGASSYLAPGTHQNVQIRLNQSISSSKTLTAVVQTDSNGNQAFDYEPTNPSTDLAYIQNGQPVSDTARVTVSGGAQTTQAVTTQATTQAGTTRAATTQAGTTQAGTTQVGTTRATTQATTRAGTTQAGTTKVGTTQATTQVGTTEIGTTQATTRAATTGAATTEAATTRVGTTQATTQVGTTQIGTTQAETTQAATTQAGTTQAATTQADAQPPQAANVTFTEQTVKGRTITVESVTVPNGGFVVLHDSRILRGDKPPIQKVRGRAAQSVIGVSDYLSAGTHENVTIQLTKKQVRQLRRGQGNRGPATRVAAVAYRDTNDDRQFGFYTSDRRVDRPYVGPSGQLVFDVAQVRFGGNQSAMAQPRTDLRFVR